MTSNRLSKIRAASTKPKVCYPPPKREPIAEEPPPPPPPPWPPEYINAHLLCQSPRETLDYSFVLTAYESDYPYHYHGYSDNHRAYASVDLLQQDGQYIIQPYSITAYGSVDDFMAYNGPPQVIEPGAFQLSTTSWRWQTPSDATIKLDIAYPAGV